MSALVSFGGIIPAKNFARKEVLTYFSSLELLLFHRVMGLKELNNLLGTLTGRLRAAAASSERQLATQGRRCGRQKQG